MLLDASALVTLFVLGENTELVRRRLDVGPVTATVLDFAVGEFASAISRLVRMGDYTAADGADLLVIFDAWHGSDAMPEVVVPRDMRLAASLVRRFDLKLSMADALYIAAARRLGQPLATFDARQASAARRLGLPLVDFDA